MNKYMVFGVALLVCTGIRAADEDTSIGKAIRRTISDKVSELRTQVKNDTDRDIYVAWKGTLSRKGSYVRIKQGESKNFVHSGDTLIVDLPPTNDKMIRQEVDLTKKTGKIVGSGYKHVTVAQSGNNNFEVKSSK